MQRALNLVFHWTQDIVVNAPNYIAHLLENIVGLTPPRPAISPIEIGKTGTFLAAVLDSDPEC